MAAALLLTVQVGFGGWVLLGGRYGAGTDLAVYYESAKAVAAGEDPYVRDPQKWESRARADGIAVIAWPYRYPPLLASLVRPLTPLPFPLVELIWVAASIVAFAGAAILLSLILSGRALDVSVLTLVAASVPALYTLFIGQANAFVLLGVAAYLFLSGTRRDLIGAIPLALTILLKPLALAVVALALWRGGRRAAAGIAVGSAGGILVSVALTGVRPWSDYLTAAWSVSRLSPDDRIETDVANQSVFALFARLTDQQSAWMYGIAVAVVLIGLTAVTIIARGADGRALPSETALVLSASALAVPVTFYHQLALALVGMCAAWSAGSAVSRSVIVLATAAIAVQLPWWRALAGVHPALTSLSTFAVLALFTVLLTQLWGSGRRRSHP